MSDHERLTAEGLITLDTAARLFPGRAGAGPLNRCTVGRWVARGTLGVHGKRVRLEALRVGGRWMTTRQALARFSAALAVDPARVEAPRPAAEVRKANSAAYQKLKAMGVPLP